MRKGLLIILMCCACALALGYAAYGQGQEYIDKFKEAEKLIKLFEETDEAIEAIEEGRSLPSRMKVFDVSDLIEENSLCDYAPPSPFVFDVESAHREETEIDTEPFDEYWGPEELIEMVKTSTGEENWPEEAGGFGTSEYYRGKLIIVNTPEMIEEIQGLLDNLRKNLPVLVSSSVYLLAVEEDYLKENRRKESSVMPPEAVRKILDDARTGVKVKLLRTGYLTSYSAQAAYLHCGALHTYLGNTDTSAAGGMTAATVFDPVINVFREGFIIGLRAEYYREKGDINLIAMVSLSRLTGIEEHTGIGGGAGKNAPQKVKVETPSVDLQVVSGSADVPEGCGLLVGGSRMKTTQAEQKSFVVLVVPQVQK